MQELFQQLWAKRIKFFLISGIFFFLTIIYLIIATNWYTATIKIIPSEPNDNMMLRQYASIAALAGVNIPMGAASQHYFYPEIIKSNFILNRILEHKFKTEDPNIQMTVFDILGIEIDSSETDWKFKLYEKTKKRFRNSFIKTEIDELTEMIIVSIELPNDRIFVTEVANFIITELDKYNRIYKRTKAKDQRLVIEKGIKENLKNLKKAEAKLVQFEIKNKDVTSPEKKVFLNGLQMDVDIFYTIVKELKKQLELIKIEEVKQTPTLDILEKASKPYEASKPKKIVFLFLGLIISILIAFFSVLFPLSTIKDYFNISKIINK